MGFTESIALSVAAATPAALSAAIMRGSIVAANGATDAS
jgi:hypothetical protein